MSKIQWCMSQHYKPIIEIVVVSKRVLIPSDDDALIQNFFVSLMESYMNGFTKLQWHVPKLLDRLKWEPEMKTTKE
jgi:hypothetical protein